MQNDHYCEIIEKEQQNIFSVNWGPPSFPPQTLHTVLISTKEIQP